MSYIRRSDRKKLPHSSGITSTSDSSDKSAPIELHTTVMSEDQNQQEGEIPKAEITDMSLEDIEGVKKLLEEMYAESEKVSEALQNAKKKIKKGKGISFLDMKVMEMIKYINNSNYYVLLKLNGKKIENDPVIKRLAESRIVLEKIRPIEEKLKYQINKMVASASSENVDTSDPLKFRANPDSLDVQDDDADDDDVPEAKEESKLYVPPKISAAYYDEESVFEKKKKALEQAQKRALSSSMLYELRREYDTGPEEISETIDPYKLKISEEMKERERFEEEYMTRLPMTKKQRHEMRQLTTVTNFNTRFENISALDMTPDNMQLKKKSNGKKRKFKNKGKSKGSKRRH